jgi:hypothetical protein
MKGTGYLRWFRRLLILGAVVSALAVAQGAGAMAPTPDTQGAGGAALAAPDAFERFADAHPYGLGAANAAAVSRPPDVADAARTGGTGSSTQSSVSWGDWAIGIGVGAALAVLFGAALLMDHRRHDVRTA